MLTDCSTNSKVCDLVDVRFTKRCLIKQGVDFYRKIPRYKPPLTHLQLLLCPHTRDPPLTNEELACDLTEATLAGASISVIAAITIVSLLVLVR